MALIHILRPPDAEGQRLEDDVEDSLLTRTDVTIENENEVTTIVEYCLKECAEEIHQPDNEAKVAAVQAIERGEATSYCARHVHRSVHVTLKKWPEGLRTELHRLDVDGWARTLINGMLEERARTGQPVELIGTYTQQELGALKRVLAEFGGTCESPTRH